ncbi:hypothetical protein J6590_071712 [Homalodisca vitripennis]|nr:hypothetical protein J6590_071712 [Homalodisca vitripennis]
MVNGRYNVPERDGGNGNSWVDFTLDSFGSGSQWHWQGRVLELTEPRTWIITDLIAPMIVARPVCPGRRLLEPFTNQDCLDCTAAVKVSPLVWKVMSSGSLPRLDWFLRGNLIREINA